MWDTWLYWRQGTYYLFNLFSPFDGGGFCGIAMATSVDGVHWNEHGAILEKADDVTWLGTGSVWKAPAIGADSRFILNFSEWRGNGQTIFFAESNDLLHWRRLDNEYEFRPDPRWYRTDGRWDCIFTIDRPGGGYFGYWTANPLDFTGFGFGESLDGVTWNALEPPRIDWGDVAPMPEMESGAVAKIGDRYYTMLGSYHASEAHSSGMFAFVAESPSGPFRPLGKNFEFLTSPLDRHYSYFTRFFPFGDALLVNYHAILSDAEVYFAPLKQAVVDADGIMRLAWWPQNGVVKQDWKESPVLDMRTGGAISYDAVDGLLVEGRLDIQADSTDSHPEFNVSYGQQGRKMRFGVQAGGVLDIADIGADGTSCLLEHVDRGLELHGSADFRILLMHRFVEVYVSNYLIQALTLPDAPAGRLEIAGACERVQYWCQFEEYRI